jgi:dipeptidyl aminopeptidase/acylaminoacyl peptidase
MGTILAIKTAAELPEITRTIIMLTYGSIAENIWTWWFIHPAKRRAIRQGYTMESLDKKLAPISPIPNAPKLKGKKILLYIAFRDKILVYKQSHQFQEALDRAGVDYQLVENTKHGHNLSAYENFRQHSHWLTFLNS